MVESVRKFDVAVVGATGAVGEVMLAILSQRDFPVGKVYALASAESEVSGWNLEAVAYR